MWGAITFPVLHDVISSALQTTSCIFFFLQISEAELARHESSTQDECLGLRNICSVFISRRITSIMHHKHVIGSSWGKFPASWGNSTVLPGELGKSLVCVPLLHLTPHLTTSLFHLEEQNSRSAWEML